MATRKILEKKSENEILVKLKGGGYVDVSGDIWTGRGSTLEIAINFLDFPSIALHLIPSIKKTTLHYLKNYAAGTLRSQSYVLRHFLRHLIDLEKKPIKNITDAHILNYYDNLEYKNKWYLGNLSVFLNKWHGLGYPGVSAEAIKVLKKIRKVGNVKGLATLTMDLHKGPFSDLEFEALNYELLTFYEFGDISQQDFCLMLLILSFGFRPVQLAWLKVKDCVGYTPSSGGKYELEVPVPKNGLAPRSEFRTFLIHSDFGEILTEHANAVKNQFSGLLADQAEAPLFPGENIDNEGNLVENLQFHRLPSEIGERIRSIGNSLYVISERTAQPLNVFPTRFRRSYGTRLRSEGRALSVIAYLLCHHDMQNVTVYSGESWAAAERIDKGTALMLAPLIQAFLGEIVVDESEAIRGNDPSSRIFDPRITGNNDPMGNCGKYGFCGLCAPIACYTCRTFNPWLDGPHEIVFNHLVSERERLMKSDKKIASILDRTILAVAEVIRRCEEMYAMFDAETEDER